MANKNLTRSIISALLLCFCLSLVFADDTETTEVNYFIDRSEREVRFIQRLIWNEAEFVLRYVVVVQRREPNGTFREVSRIETENAYAEVSLLAGSYRYNVTLYDLFDEETFTTQWREFEVFRALQPAVSSYSPSAFYLDEDDVWEITVRGRNILPQSEVYLISIEGNRIIRPIRHTPAADGNSTLVVFSGAALYTGRFEVYIKNPGGLDTKMSTFTIANKKPFDINLSGGYSPLIPVYGFLFNDFDFGGNNVPAPFPGFFYPLGVGIKSNFMPFKRVYGNMGVELSAAFFMLSHDHEVFEPNALLFDAHVSFLYQYFFIRKVFAVNLSIGAGFSFLQGFKYDYPGSNIPYEVPAVLYPSAIGNVSFTVFVSRPYFISFGADFVHVFSAETPMPGYIRPFIFAGIQF
ncbi:MAG: hypothetical protein FWD28_06015 [Treponema sp.]|nr:hypothetical protein [Treponema sp.]